VSKRNVDSSYFKSAVFGFEDGLVSTTGIVAGLSAGSHDPKLVLMGGLVAMGVEAVSMGAGEFISERGVHAMRGNRHTDSPTTSGLVMSFSFVVAGFIPLAPIMLLKFPHSVLVSLALALVALFCLGIAKTRVVNAKGYLRSAIETLVIGGVATLIGFLVGFFLKLS